MPLPVPSHFDYASEPLSTISVNEDWYSVLQGIFEFSLNTEFWDGDDDDFANIEQAIIGIMTLGALIGGTAVQIKTGSYIGDGETSQAVTGIGFLPVVVICWLRSGGDNNRGIAIRATSDTQALSISGEVGTMQYNANIISLDADGFSVNSQGGSTQFRANLDGWTYTYVAIGE